MLIAADVTKRFPIPHEAGEWIEARELGFVELEAVRKQKEYDALEKARTMGAAFISELEAVTKDDKPKEPKPAELYDRAKLIMASVTAWSYQAEPTPANIGQLDEVTAEWLFGELVAMYHPDDDARPFDSSTSTATLTENEE